MGQEFSRIARNCERAVVTAYRELRQIGSDDLAAFQACTSLYRIHHPEASINEARRLVMLIDELYEASAKLIVLAAAEPDDLYPAGDGAFEFERTASRLQEMRSQGYLEKARE